MNRHQSADRVRANRGQRIGILTGFVAVDVPELERLLERGGMLRA